MLFRKLEADEIPSFQKWARDNDTAGHRADAEIYHPVVRAEWARIDSEKAAQNAE